MEKVLNITIGKRIFPIEEDAHKKLSKYLDSIKRHFDKDKSRDEILEDIESSIGEKFHKRHKKDIAISLKDVEKVMEEMGSVKDFGEEPEEDEADAPKKLYRDPDDKIIAGVASGLAAYFGLESSLVRLAFFVSIFFGGLGVVLYLLLWIAIPEAETTNEKLEMRGERITLQEIEKSVKSGVEKLKKKDLTKLDKKLHWLGKGIVWSCKALLVIIAVSLMIAGISSVFALSFAVTWVVTGAGLPDLGYTLSDFIVLEGTLYWLFSLSLYILLFVPFFLLFLLGLSLLKHRATISALPLAALLALWFSAGGFVTAIAFDQYENIETKVLEIEKHFEHRPPYVKIDY